MKNEENIEDKNLRIEAPRLFGLKKEEPFTAPDGYFENFRVDLPGAIQQDIPWWQVIFKPVVWAPAMVILIVGSLFLLNDNENSTETKTAKTEKVELELNSISYDVLDAYVHDHLLAQVNSDELMEMVGEKNMPSLGISVENPAQTDDEAPAIESVDEEEMEEYIMENLDEMEIL